MGRNTTPCLKLTSLIQRHIIFFIGKTKAKCRMTVISMKWGTMRVYRRDIEEEEEGVTIDNMRGNER